MKKFQMAVQKQEEKQMELERVERELLKKKLELEHKEFDIQMWKDSSEKYAVVSTIHNHVIPYYTQKINTHQ